MTCTNTAAIGAYLLGALEPEERSAFESHIAGCDICRTELVRLAPLPGLLHQISPADFDELHEHPLPPVPIGEAPVAVGEPAEVTELPALDSKPAPTPAAATPRKRYWRVAAAAVLVVVLTIGGVLGYRALTGPNAPVTDGIIWSATDPATGVRADVKLINKAWGTELHIWMTNSPPDRDCRLVVHANEGSHEKNPYRETAGWWKTGHDPGEEIPGATAIAMADINRLEFMVEDKVLVGIHSPR